MSLTYLSFLAVSFAVSQVSAHGFIANVQVGGQYYSGFDPNYDLWDQSREDKIIRNIPNDSPVLDIWNDALACNQGGQMGQGTATADVWAGEDVRFSWNVWPADHRGPVSCYMAKCDNDCSSFSVNNAKWFKLNAEGRYEDGKWATDKLIEMGHSWTCKIPQGLQAGNYLLRHEIIAMHEVGAPQFYPACAQLNVKGGANASPADWELTTIPGLYQGAEWPDIYAQSVSFNIPGPSVARLVYDNGNSGQRTAQASDESDDSEEDSESCSTKRSSKKARKLAKRHSRLAPAHST